MPPVHVGIPFGAYHLPAGLYKEPEFSGALRGMSTDTMLANLAAARRANLRVMVSFAGAERMIRDEGGFSLAKWKARIDRFRAIDFSSYIEDGTIIGHYIMDEPSDPTNWNGKVVEPATIDEMARYSKELWPGMPTIIRGWARYLKGYDYKYLDAAWAQYRFGRGPIEEFIAKNVADAKASNLALVVGLNVLAGGGKDGLHGYYNSVNGAMTVEQLKTWGGALLAEPYVCAFISWRYNTSGYFSRPDIKAALSDLNDLARAHPKKACRN